ncbi:hypothetical protein [uncultured Alistipes sp.]|jgi:hypothetical protein|uniref:hypothetical protein n=1 Tax=uncultured Alistipes sp. TaxID=538949 RepID=UPI00259B2658|nr:hypothetical protein [uncultured Alistipes sp.]
MNKRDIISKLIGNYLDVDISSDGYITVAELKTTEGNISVDLNTALISPALVSRIKSSHVNPFVETSGAYFDKNYVYKPSFWLYVSPSSGLKKAEPLVVSWKSANKTILSIDQGFLSAFCLVPRLLKDEIYWDELSQPDYEVVKNRLASEYEFPNQTEAYVKVKKGYLDQYLACRKKVAVQLFTIIKEIDIDDNIKGLLNEKGYYIEEFNQFEIRISKFSHKEDVARLEINGYKIIQVAELRDDTSPAGHYWKGIEGIVTEDRTRHKMVGEYAYISDDVLQKYEVDDDYEVHPDSGGVRYRGQWAVSHCERIGRNGIKVELKKLYEGTPDDVIGYWNKYSIDISEVGEGENIAAKAKRLTRKYFLFGRLFCQVANKICHSSFSPIEIITLDQDAIDYTGWADFPDYKPISHHVCLRNFSKEDFICRCKKLYILLGENLQERNLRKIINTIGFSLDDTKSCRSLKLLEFFLKYLFVSVETGLDPIQDKETIVGRTKELTEFNMLSKLFALNDIRQLDAHKKGNFTLKFNLALEEFDIEPPSISNNYARICDQIYDGLNDLFVDINNLLLKSI